MNDILTILQNWAQRGPHRLFEVRYTGNDPDLPTEFLWVVRVEHTERSWSHETDPQAVPATAMLQALDAAYEEGLR